VLACGVLDIDRQFTRLLKTKETKVTIITACIVIPSHNDTEGKDAFLAQLPMLISSLNRLKKSAGIVMEVFIDHCFITGL